MPNPLLGRQRVTSKPPTEHIDAVTPLVDSYEGDNIPYRGLENHGVATGNRTEDQSDSAYLAPDAMLGDLITYTDEPSEPDPIAVRIVEMGSKDFKTFSTGRVYAGAAASIIVGRRENRTNVKLKNLGTATVYVGPNSSTQVFTGWPIPVGIEWTYEGDAEVWAVSEDGAQQALAVFSEYVV